MGAGGPGAHVCRGCEAVARDVESGRKALVRLVPDTHEAVVLRSLAQQGKALKAALRDVAADGDAEPDAAVGAAEHDAGNFVALVHGCQSARTLLQSSDGAPFLSDDAPDANLQRGRTRAILMHYETHDASQGR